MYMGPAQWVLLALSVAFVLVSVVVRDRSIQNGMAWCFLSLTILTCFGFEPILRGVSAEVAERCPDNACDDEMLDLLRALSPLRLHFRTNPVGLTILVLRRGKRTLGAVEVGS